MKQLVLVWLAVGLVLAGLLVVLQPTTLPTTSVLKKFGSEYELKAFLKAGSVSLSGGTLAAQDTMRIQTSMLPSAETKAGETAGTDYSKTNIQVEGVDEADIVKTDGEYIYSISGTAVVITKAFPPESAAVVSVLNFSTTPEGVFVNKDRLIILYNDWQTGTTVAVYDVSDKTAPVLKKNVTINGSYVASRMTDNHVYLITTKYAYYSNGGVLLPEIATNGVAKAVPATEVYYDDVQDSSYAFTNVLALNVQDDASQPAVETFLLGASRTVYVSQKNVYLTYEKRMSAFQLFNKTLEKVILPLLPEDVKTIALNISASDNYVYEKVWKITEVVRAYAENLTSGEQAEFWTALSEKAGNLSAELAKEREKTAVHKISVNGLNIKYAASGEVPGTVLNQFSMDEHGQYFRIATTTRGSGGGVIGLPAGGSPTQSVGMPAQPITVALPITAASRPALPLLTVMPPPVSLQSESANHLYVLDNSLNIVGKLEDLAPGERIYSVRFMGDRAYMVTYRQIDPFFVIDLKTPHEPKVLGFLKIPGVSDYLHPYDENHVIGVGRDATEEGRITGLKLALYDVTDVANPKEAAKQIIGERGTTSEAIYDHKAFLFSKDKKLLVIPVNLVEGDWSKTWQGAYVFNIDLNGFTLKGSITHAEPSNYSYDTTVKRALYIENILYTISQAVIKANSLDDLSEISSVKLPYSEPEYGGGHTLQELRVGPPVVPL